MSLLDFGFDTSTPEGKQAKMMMSLGLLGATKGNGQNFATNLAQNLMQARNYQEQLRNNEMNRKLKAMQMQGAEMDFKTKKRDFESDEALTNHARNYFTAGQAARPETMSFEAGLPEYARIPGMPAQAAKPAGFDAQGFLGGLSSVPNVNPLKAMEFAKKFQPKETEFSTEPRFTPDGKAYLIGKDGTVKWLDGVKPRDKLVETNLGGKVALRSEYSPITVAEMNKIVSPDAVLGAQTTMRGQNLVDARSRDANNISKALGITEKELRIGEMQDKRDERNRAKEAGKASVMNQIAVIDKALNHPGRETATGLSGTLNPTNYIPGTDATDFRAVLDQIGGTAFLQAFESLKGGGAITEVEGKKATDAIARLNRAQSDAEFKRSLQDLRSVMAAGAQRLGATPQTGGATGSFDAPPQMPQGFRVIR